MLRMNRLLALALMAVVSIGSVAQSPSSHAVWLAHEPAQNLSKLKTQLIAYHDCTGIHGCYTTDLDHQSARAIAFLDRRTATAKAQEKLALVLDIDETSLSNWEEEKQDDFGYISKDWNAWIDAKKAPAIASTLRLYNDAMKHGVAVFFVTGRPESQRDVTVENLNSAGYHDWKGLALRGDHPASQTTSDYKSSERKKIVDAGYRIILNVGDQLSDLNGSPQAELSVKLPNPFYYLP